jgi:hypothetical protein
MEKQSFISEMQEEFTLAIDLFKNEFEIFKHHFALLPYPLLSMDNSKPLQLVHKDIIFAKTIALKGLQSFSEVEKALDSFSKSVSKEDYLTLIGKIQLMSEEVQQELKSIAEIQDILIPEAVSSSWLNFIRRHKHLIKHFLLGLKSFIPVEVNN